MSTDDDKEYDRMPGVPSRTMALNWILSLVRGLAYRHNTELYQEMGGLEFQLEELDRAMSIYDRLHHRDLDDDERLQLELEVERAWMEGWGDD